MAQWVKDGIVSVVVQVLFLAWGSGLRIWHCCGCGIGSNCTLDSNPGLETSICLRYSRETNKNQKPKTKTPRIQIYLWTEPDHQGAKPRLDSSTACQWRAFHCGWLDVMPQSHTQMSGHRAHYSWPGADDSVTGSNSTSSLIRSWEMPFDLSV